MKIVYFQLEVFIIFECWFFLSQHTFPHTASFTTIYHHKQQGPRCHQKNNLRRKIKRPLSINMWTLLFSFWTEIHCLKILNFFWKPPSSQPYPSHLTIICCLVGRVAQHSYQVSVLTCSEDVLLAAAPRLDLQREHRVCELQKLTRMQNTEIKWASSWDLRQRLYVFSATFVPTLQAINMFKHKCTSWWSESNISNLNFPSEKNPRWPEDRLIEQTQRTQQLKLFVKLQF